MGNLTFGYAQFMKLLGFFEAFLAFLPAQ